MAAIDLRYARALAAVVSDQKLDPGASQRELNDFADTLEASSELREVLQNPSIPEPQKLKVLDAIAARAGMSRTVRNMIALITHHERLHELRDLSGQRGRGGVARLAQGARRGSVLERQLRELCLEIRETVLCVLQGLQFVFDLFKLLRQFGDRTPMLAR